MTRLIGTLLVLSRLLSACIPNGPTHQQPATSPTPTLTSAAEAPTGITPVITQESLPPPELEFTLTTPHSEPGPTETPPIPTTDTQQCGYQWAYQDLPELSAEFLQSLQQLQPEAQGNAYIFGENCVRAEGTIASFSAIETDFNVTLQVSDLSSAAELGEWIVKVMGVIEQIPPNQIQGPRPGRVSMTFQSNGEQKVINFYIDQYQRLPTGLSHAEIYQALQMPQ